MPPDSPVSDTGFVASQTAHGWPGNVLIGFNTVLVVSEAALASGNTVPVVGNTAQGCPEDVLVTSNTVPVVVKDVVMTCHTVLMVCPTALVVSEDVLASSQTVLVASNTVHAQLALANQKGCCDTDSAKAHFIIGDLVHL